MKFSIDGGKSFSYIRVTLAPGERIITESDAMSSMDSGIDLKSQMRGGFIKAILRMVLGKESFFMSSFKNTTKKEKNIILTQPVPGEITEVQLDGESLCIQPGAYIASTEDIEFRMEWAGFASMLGGEGLFRIRLTGKGTVFYGSYGAVIEKEVDGEFVVDTGHLLSYPPGMKLKIQFSGGIFSSFFGGEGLVLKLIGKGTIKIQTRSLGGLAGWLNPRFW